MEPFSISSDQGTGRWVKASQSWGVAVGPSGSVCGGVAVRVAVTASVPWLSVRPLMRG
jgi:hypothetical protein